MNVISENFITEIFLKIKQVVDIVSNRIKIRLAALGSLHPKQTRLDHKHVGSLHAADAQMAIENARDVYTRRMEGVSIWVVESQNIFMHPILMKQDELYEPAIDKVYRHPTFYDLPDEVNICKNE